MLSIISITQARLKLLDLVRQCETLHEPFVITKEGKASAVLMNAQEFEEWVATLEIVTDKRALKSLRKGLRDLKVKRTKSFKSVFGEPVRKSRARR